MTTISITPIELLLKPFSPLRGRTDNTAKSRFVLFFIFEMGLLSPFSETDTEQNRLPPTIGGTGLKTKGVLLL